MGEVLLVAELGVVVDLVGRVEEQLGSLVDVGHHPLLGLGQIHRGSVLGLLDRPFRPTRPDRPVRNGGLAGLRPTWFVQPPHVWR